eukprot:6464424-Amphidinium_carterae.1
MVGKRSAWMFPLLGAWLGHSEDRETVVMTKFQFTMLELEKVANLDQYTHACSVRSSETSSGEAREGALAALGETEGPDEMIPNGELAGRLEDPVSRIQLNSAAFQLNCMGGNAT